MKNLVVLYNKDDWDEPAPVLTTSTRQAFEAWHEQGQAIGVNFFRAHIKWYDEDTNAFQKAWMFREGQWQKESSPITPDLVFDKVASKHDYRYFDLKMRMSQKVKLYNSPIFKTLLGNKLAQYLYCKDVMAPSWLAGTPEELASIFSQTTDTDIVLKPLYGSGGKGILIGEKASLIKEPLEFPLFVQTFVPAKGIPGFSNPEELADLRLVYINHELIYAISRIAKPSSLFTNFHQGATAVMVPLEKIPSSALALADGIVKKLEVFSEANYALDLMFDLSLKPFLVEINTTPGFDLLREFGDKDTNQRYFQAFIKNIPL